MVIGKSKMICGVGPGALARCRGIAALDMDGVISDTWLGVLRCKNPTLSDPRIMGFIEDNPHYFENGTLSSHGVKSIQIDSLCYLAQMAQETKTGFVLVSSWIRNPNTYLAVQDLFLHLTGLKYEQPLFLGQTSGAGGEHREAQFLEWVRLHTCESEPKEIIAIDDSGIRHFPLLMKTHNLVAPIGRTGFTVDDYIRCLRKLNCNDQNWYHWSERGHLSGVELPLHTKDELWARIHQNNKLTSE